MVLNKNEAIKLYDKFRKKGLTHAQSQKRLWEVNTVSAEHSVLSNNGGGSKKKKQPSAWSSTVKW